MRRFAPLLALLVLSFVIVDSAWAQRSGRRAEQARRVAAEARGEMLAQSCFACHGPRGASSAHGIPTIGGQGVVYLSLAMRRFKEGNRPASVMDRIAKGYTDQEIMEIAQYVSRQPFVRNEQPVDLAKVEVGARAYRRICSECHLDNGRDSSDAEYPILAGQRLTYLQMQMNEIYTTGRRAVDEKFFGMLTKLSRDEVDAALHFFASQR